MVAACASPEEELEEATAQAFTDQLPFVDQAEVQCLAAGYMADLGIDGFALSDLDRDAIAAEPAKVKVLLTEQPSVFEDCVDLEAVLGEAIVADGGKVSPDCLELDIQPNQELTKDLFDRRDLGDLSGPAKDQLIDAVRGCIDDKAFARYAELSDPDELGKVLIADPFAWINDPEDQDPCIIEAVVKTLGVERLDELGVTIEEPELVKARPRLGDEELDRLATAYTDCDLKGQILRAIGWTEEQISDCVVEDLDPESQHDAAVVLTKGFTPTFRSPMRELVYSCTDDAVTAMFGAPLPLQDLSDVERNFQRAFMSGITETTDSTFEVTCMQRGIMTTLDEPTVIVVENVLATYQDGGLPTTADEQLYFDYMFEVTEIGTMCFRPWRRLQNELIFAEVDEAAWPCIRREIDPAVLDATMESLAAALWSDEYPPLLVVEQGYDEFHEAIGSCGSRTDIRNWDRFMDNYTGVDGEAPDPVAEA